MKESGIGTAQSQLILFLANVVTFEVLLKDEAGYLLIFRVIGGLGVVAILAAMAASQLELNMRYADMLPERSPGE